MTNVKAVEVGAKRLFGSPVYCLKKDMGFKSKPYNRTTKAVFKAVEKSFKLGMIPLQQKLA